MVNPGPTTVVRTYLLTTGPLLDGFLPLMIRCFCCPDDFGLIPSDGERSSSSSSESMSSASMSLEPTN